MNIALKCMIVNQGLKSFTQLEVEGASPIALVSNKHGWPLGRYYKKGKKDEERETSDKGGTDGL